MSQLLTDKRPTIALYSKTTKPDKFLDENNNTEFAIKNKPKKLLNLLKWFKFVVTLVLIKKNNKQK